MPVTLGIDEAGRGPAIGPMVLAAVALETRAARALTRAGLADSKSYGAGEAARTTRSELAARVRELAVHVSLEVVEVSVIDRRVMLGELNVLEREVASRLIDGAPSCDRIVCDGATLFSSLTRRYPVLEAHNDGESRHAAVAAASVIAKVRRDQLFEEIRARYSDEFGEISGGGYVNHGTRRFLCAYAERYRALLPEARRSWPHPYVVELIGDRWQAPPPQLPLL